MFAVKSNPYRITLIDDGSPNDTFGKRLNDEGDKGMLRCVRSEHQKGFGAALRLGYENTQQPWILVMHSDTRVDEPNWMVRLGESLLRFKETDPTVKLISSRTNNPGAGHEPQLKATKPLVAAPNAKRDPDIVLKEGFVPLYSAMFHRELFKHIGGFIKEYPFGYYEDEELGWRMRAYGYRQAICGASWVYHDAGATVNSVCKANPDAAKVMDGNHEKCVEDIRLHPRKKQKA